MAEGAEQIYGGRALGRFSQRFLAFKRVSEELGRPWFEAWLERLMANVQGGKIATTVPVKDRADARAFLGLWNGASTWNRLTEPYGEGHENQGLLGWKPINVPPALRLRPEPDPDPSELTKKVKQMALFLGANRVGVAELNRKWVYEETCRNIYDPGPPQTKRIVFRAVEEPEETDEELIIPEGVRYAVVTVMDLNRVLTQVGPASLSTSIATNMAYARMGITDIALAEAIRMMGYNAIPCKNGTALSIPLAIDAGLGQLGRNGLLITPEYGPAVRIGKVLTDMPLVPDRPVDFGVTEFCKSCKKCAERCPAGAIPRGDMTYEPPSETGNPGALKWYVDGKKCLRYWIASGASCASCQAVCPFTKGGFWGHKVIRGFIKYVPWLDPLWVLLDDLFGYGRMREPSVVWEVKMAPFGIDPSKEG